jgi:hypothetical protein
VTFKNYSSRSESTWWFQKRRLKCKCLRTTKTTTVPSTSDDYTSHDLWPFGSGELKFLFDSFRILLFFLVDDQLFNAW